MLFKFLDIFFLVFHTSVIVFNCLGWIWIITRKWNLMLLLITGLSWTLLGIWYGFGYCPCTDWHWNVLEELGRQPETPSYIEYLYERLSGWEVTTRIANQATVWTYILLLVVSTVLNIRDYKKNRL